MENTYCFAGLSMRVNTVGTGVHRLCRPYATNAPARIAVRVTQDDIEHERSREDRPGYSDAYLEALAVCRKVAEKTPEHGTFLFHGSAIAVDGQAYVFTARSGTGKSTHARLWRDMLGERAVMVNDDKPLVRVHADGTATAYGTPWDGKHRLSHNIAAPVRAICILERAEENRIRRISKREALPTLLQQAYRPASRAALAHTLALIDRLNVNLYRLGCNMEMGAAEVAYAAMSGE